MDKTVVKIDVTDWHEEALRNESFVTSDDDILSQLAKGISTPALARSAIVSREKKLAPTDIVRPNKMLLMTGGMLDISQMVRSKKRIITTEDGENVLVGEYIGAVRVQDESDVNEDTDDDIKEAGQKEYEPSYVTIDNHEAALKRIQDYMEHRIPGHIWNKLVEVYTVGGDVRNEADKLKDTIDTMVNKLT